MLLRCVHVLSHSADRRLILQLFRRPYCKFTVSASNLKLSGGFNKSIKITNGYQVTVNRSLLHNQVASFFTSSQTHQRQQNDEQQNDWPTEDYIFDVVILGSVFLVLLFGYAHLSPDIKTITWEIFANKVLPSGEVEKITISSLDLAIVKIRQDAPHQYGERIRRDSSHTREIILQGGFKNGVELESLIRNEERKMNINPEGGVNVMYKWDAVKKQKDYIDGINSVTSAIKVLLVIYGCIAVRHFYGMKYTPGFLPMNKQIRNLFARDSPPSSENSVFGGFGGNFKTEPTTSSGTDHVKLADVAGLSEAKQEVTEFIHFLTEGTAYKELGAKMPKGCLLTGPPGCGKTLMARAVANEAGVPFIAKAGSDFVEVIGGMGARRIRALFKEAREQAPCIIFIDEIDAVGGSRDGDGPGESSNREKAQTVNQLLVEMDGMLSEKDQVVVMAATNRADMLDKALLRAGRFDRLIDIDLPSLQDRRDILEVHLAKLKLEKKPEDYSTKLAHMTPGMSGAELANLCNEAAICAARWNDKQVTNKHLHYAIERVIAGSAKSSNTISPEERRVVAVHESGHVLVGWLLEHTDALAKVTIVPRTGGALGFAQNTPTDRKLFTEEQILDVMCMTLGGRAAEDLIFNRITNGAQDDLKKVTKMAYAQVKHFGFNPVVGEISFSSQSEHFYEPYSDALWDTIDRESRSMVSKAYEKTRNLLKSNRSLLQKLADQLYERETLDYDDVKQIIGTPPFGDKRKVMQIPNPSDDFGLGGKKRSENKSDETTDNTTDKTTTTKTTTTDLESCERATDDTKSS